MIHQQQESSGEVTNKDRWCYGEAKDTDSPPLAFPCQAPRSTCQSLRHPAIAQDPIKHCTTEHPSHPSSIPTGPC